MRWYIKNTSDPIVWIWQGQWFLLNSTCSNEKQRKFPTHFLPTSICENRLLPWWTSQGDYKCIHHKILQHTCARTHVGVLVKKQGILLFLSTSSILQVKLRAELRGNHGSALMESEESESVDSILQVNLILLSPLRPVSHLLCKLDLLNRTFQTLQVLKNWFYEVQ